MRNVPYQKEISKKPNCIIPILTFSKKNQLIQNKLLYCCYRIVSLKSNNFHGCSSPMLLLLNQFLKVKQEKRVLFHHIESPETCAPTETKNGGTWKYPPISAWCKRKVEDSFSLQITSTLLKGTSTFTYKRRKESTLKPVSPGLK